MFEQAGYAGLRVTPRCETTGLALLISTFEPQEPGARYKQKVDFHHANSPESSDELQSIIGSGLRYSLGQNLNRTVHNRYTARFSGPDLALSDEEKFKQIIFATAGIRSRHALALRMQADNDEVIELTPQQYRVMCNPNIVHYQDAHHINPSRRRHARAKIGRACAEFALRKEVVGTLKGGTIRSFLNPKISDERKLDLGMSIIEEAIGLSVDNLVQEHRDLVNEGYSIKRQALPLTTTLGRFFTQEYFADYFDEVTQRLQVVNPM